MGAIIRLVSSNKHKLREIRVVARAFGVDVEPSGHKKLEIQSDDLEEIVVSAAESVKDEVRNAILEDAGLFIERLGGFPGPYSSYVYKKLGCNGVLRLLEGERDRRAYFESALAYIDEEGRIRVFTSRVWGLITQRPRGGGGFGFDPIFIPAGFSRTFSEMSVGEKAWVSHRGRAVLQLMRWLEYYKKGYKPRQTG